ncbi:hypothetical protein [uncultured Microscilla sp.]|uniref:hypothetical protein n=1 Tax=uncultured Microscilla sp. TaxID=432653 RepID=UPI00260ECCD3|nr:hypothetical protein [uncultured Microscilla sp.]
MRKFILLISLAIWVSACNSDQKDKQQTQAHKKKLEEASLAQSQEKLPQKNVKEAPEVKEGDEGYLVEHPEKKDANAQSRMSAIERLKLKGSAQLEYAKKDFQVLREDTTITIDNNAFVIHFQTTCLNDGGVAQEVIPMDGRDHRTYLISHNYKTEVSVKLNGKSTGKDIIQKDLFKGHLNADFLRKSIIRHPQFVKFNEDNAEAIFSFMVGVPHTDWVALATVGVGQFGKSRVIKVESLGM